MNDRLLLLLDLLAESTSYDVLMWVPNSGWTIDESRARSERIVAVLAEIKKS